MQDPNLRECNARRPGVTKHDLGSKWCLHRANSPLRVTHPKQYPSRILHAVQVQAILAGRL